MTRTTTFLLVLFGTQIGIAQQYRMIAPQTFMSGMVFPFVVEIEGQNRLDLFHSEEILFDQTGCISTNGLLKIKKGRGLFTSISDGSGAINISSDNFNVNPDLNSSAVIEHGGNSNGNQTWTANSVHRISSQLTISSNDTLTMENGCWIVLDSAVNMVIEGHLRAQGAEQNAIVLASNGPQAWGGLIFTIGSGSLTYTIFNNGGADASLAFGHSGSQAVVSSSGGELNMDHCYIFDCPGKGIGSQNGLIQFNNGAISRCDMGGEFINSRIQIKTSHVLDIPNDDGLFQDDDNDGFYFSGTHQSGGSMVDSCIFMFGKDDALDHNGAILQVRNSWVENFENEGMAASNTNSVLVYNSLFKNCEQGIETGYGTPLVTVDHCVMVGNDNGLRFGDWYDWGCQGSIICTNSIMVDNQDNIHNYDYLTAAPVVGAIQVDYSLTNDSEYDGNLGCLSGQPTFSSHYLLESGSIGIGLSNDGSNLGLIAHSPLSIEEGIWPLEPSNTGFKIFDLQGRLVHTSNDYRLFNAATLGLKNGIYVIESDSKRWKQALFE